MQKNAIWVAFLLIVVGCSLWFVVRAGYDLIRYYQLSVQLPVKVEKWDVVEGEANKYSLKASYDYEFDGKNYEGKGSLGESYPNPWAAQRALEKYEGEEHYVWLNPKAPEKGVLEKKFPYKGALSAAVLIGLAIYFICLGLYVSVKNE